MDLLNEHEFNLWWTKLTQEQIKEVDCEAKVLVNFYVTLWIAGVINEDELAEHNWYYHLRRVLGKYSHAGYNVHSR